MGNYLQDRSSIFENERILRESYTPEDLPEREEQLKRLGLEVLSPVLDNAPPHNAFLYGKPGQGKTAVARFLLQELEEEVEQREGINLTTIFQTCKGHHSSYQVTCDLVEKLTGENPNGHPKRKVFDRLYDALQEIGGIVVLVLDEVDNIGSKDMILYELPRARDNNHIEDMDVSVIGISNDMTFYDELDPRAKDSLCEVEVHFPPYNANQLRSILNRLGEKAFVDGVVIEESVALCAAFAAQDIGSARQAIRYLYKAGEFAAINNDPEVTQDHVREAEDYVESLNVTQTIRDQTLQDQLSLVALVSLAVDDETPTSTPELYSRYKTVAERIEADAIAMRRVRSHLHDLDMMGILSSTKRSGGSRGGPKYYWSLDTDLETTIEVLDENNRFEEVIDVVKTSQNS